MKITIRRIKEYVATAVSLDVYVNGKRLDIPSAVLRTGDRVTLSNKMAGNVQTKDSQERPRLELPDFLQFASGDRKEVELTAEPQPGHIPFQFELSYIAEIYSGI